MAFADAVVVAAGSSSRFGGVDKLMVDLEGRPVLEWSVAALAVAPSVGRVVVVTAAERVATLAAAPWIRALDATVVAGGERRQDSVAAGVAACSEHVVLVHDGARPFVGIDVVEAVAAAARSHGAAIPILPVVDSLKRRSRDGTVVAVERAGLFRVQTPQGAHRRLLQDAYAALGNTERLFSDEASLLEAFDVPVTTVPGDPSNLKLTDPSDLDTAHAIAAQRVGPPRYGSASDTHPFGPDDGLALGGILMAEAPRLFGHSDGDVVLHAIADALLGAAALPDLGRQFPDTEVTTHGAESGELLRRLVERVATSGWRPGSVDVSVVGARPRLGAQRLDAMRDAIAGLLGLTVDRVGVKASTGNLSGPEGAGRVISASALVGLIRR